MEKVLPHADATAQTGQYGAGWYLATTLAERLSLLQNNTLDQIPSDQATAEKAEQRFKQWKGQLPFKQSEQNFAQRLALDGLNEEDLQRLLALSAQEIQAAVSSPPAWLAELINAFEQQDTSVLNSIPFDQIGDPHTRMICLALKPLLASGFARLQSGIAEIQKHFSHLSFDPQTIGILLFPHLINPLLTHLTKTLVLELNVARVQGRLQGETPEQRFDYFLQELARPENLLALLEEYSVLARYMVEQIDRWVICELEFLYRLSADWNEICRTFFPAGDPGVLTEIQEGAGDIHQGGRSVTLLTWSSGLRLVYKPRSLAIDAHFQELLEWLNTYDCQPTFRTLKILQKGTHGWCEFATTSQCASKEEIQRFYQRQGGYLALLYALEAIDFHAQNLLASGEHPMLIDIETLFHPRHPSENTNTYTSEMFKYSVQRVGLLPERIWSDKAGEGIDLSGLVGQQAQLTPFAVPTVKGQGTDEMYIARERIEANFGSNHRPLLQGQEINTLEFENNIITGFTTVYRLLLKHRDELLRDILPRFAHDEIRVLVRQTQIYTMMQADSFHPNVLRDALDRERFLDRLWVGVEQDPRLKRLIATERADLLDDVVPRFTTSPATRDLFTARGETLTDFLTECSLDASRKCIQQMDERDLERQIWLIRASFASLTLNNVHTQTKYGLQLLPPQSQLTNEQLLSEALSIGNLLQRRAVTWEDMAGWWIMNIADGQEWRSVASGLDLYSGLPGIVLFLAYLGKFSGEEQYTALSRSALKTLQALIASLKQAWSWHSIGAYDGVGSLIYLFSHLGTLWHEPALYQEAEEIVAKFPDLIGLDEAFDVMNGSAGAIAALLSLYAVAPSESTLAMALQCGDHLLSHSTPMPQGIGWSASQQTPLAGMSHGNAGIALNLLRLAAVSKEERFHHAALEALAYERSIFSPDEGNWPDLRESPASEFSSQQGTGKQEPSYMTAWCHGAVGIGLARLASLPYHDDGAMREEIRAAVKTTLTKGFGRNHSLCHGDMGSLEFLLSAAHQLPDEYSRKELEHLQISLVENGKKEGWRSGIPMSLDTPSLMIGLAGTGYALLQQMAPEQIPSVLTLDPPRRF